MGADDIAMRATLDGSPYSSTIDSMISKAEMLGQKTMGAMDGVGGKFNEVGQAMGLEEGRIGALGNALGMTGTAFTGVAIGATAAAVAIKTSVDAAANFQTTMDRVNSLTGSSGSGLTELARQSSRDTTFSMQESVETMKLLADEGAKANDMTSMLPATLKLAEASGLDMGTAVKTLDNALDQFNISVDKSDETVNMLVAAAQKGNSSIGDMGQAMAMAGPAASGMGLSFADTASSLAIMTGAGMKAKQAGSELTSMLTQLSQPSQQVADGLASIGVSAADVNPQVHSLDEIITTLSTHGMDTQKAMETFGTSAGPGMAALLAQGEGGLKSFEASITGTNAATEAAEKASSGYEASMKKMGNSVQELQISLGTALLPPLTAVVDLMTRGVTAVNDFGGAIDKAMTRTSNDTGVKKWFEDVNDMFMGPPVKQAALDMTKMVSDTYAESDLKTVVGATLGSPASKSAVNKSAQELAAEFTKEFGSQYEAGMTQINGKWISNIESEKTYGKIGATTHNGVHLTSNFDMTSYGTIYSLKNDSGGIIASVDGTGVADPGSSAGRKSILQKLLDKAGITGLSETETLELYGDQVGADKIKLTHPLEIENLWDISQSGPRSWMKFEADNKPLAERAGVGIMSVLYQAEQRAIKENNPTLEASLGIVMKELAEPGSEPYEMFNQALADIMDAGYIDDQWKDDLEGIAKDAIKGATDIFGNAVLKAPKVDWAAFWKNPSGQVSSMDAFSSGTFQPAFTSLAKGYADAASTGLKSAEPMIDEFIDETADKMEEMPELFTVEQLSAMALWDARLETTGQLLDVLANNTTKAKTGLNYLQDAIETIGDPSSKFGNWQEQNANSMFNQGYIGPSSGYLDWAKKEAERRNQGQIGVTVGTSLLNAGVANTDLDKLASRIEDISSKPIPMTADTNPARKELDKLLKDIAAMKPTLTVAVNITAHADQIQAMATSAVNNALSNVRV